MLLSAFDYFLLLCRANCSFSHLSMFLFLLSMTRLIRRSLEISLSFFWRTLFFFLSAELAFFSLVYAFASFLLIAYCLLRTVIVVLYTEIISSLSPEKVFIFTNIYVNNYVVSKKIFLLGGVT